MAECHEWSIDVIEHGYFMDVPRAQSYYGAHNDGSAMERNDQPANVTVIQGNGHKVLVDTGFGYPQFIEKCNAGHMLTPKDYLGALGLTIQDIDIVILTHLHYDHMGYIQCFPEADVYVSRQEWEGWREAALMPPDYGLLTCYLEEHALDTIREIAERGKLHLTEDETEITEGITCYLAKGHSFGDQVVVVDTKAGKIAVCGDAAYTTENVEKMIPMGYGLSQMDMLRSFQKIKKLVEGRLENIIPGHDLEWPDRYESTRTLPGRRNRITHICG